MNEIEESNRLQLDFKKLERVVEGNPGVIPCAVQNVDTKEVILIAYVNQLALKKSIEERLAVFWSTSRRELWVKGATSGEMFELLDVRVNCDQNSLVYIVRPKSGGICHTKNEAGEARNCYYRSIDFESMKLKNLDP